MRPGLTTNWLMVGGMAAVEMEMRGFADYRAIEWRAARGVGADTTGGIRWTRCVVRFETGVVSTAMGCWQSSLQKW